MKWKRKVSKETVNSKEVSKRLVEQLMFFYEEKEKETSPPDWYRPDAMSSTAILHGWYSGILKGLEMSKKLGGE